MSDWTTDIDDPRYKAVERKYTANRPLTAAESVMACREFDVLFEPHGHAYEEAVRHLEAHIARVAELTERESSTARKFLEVQDEWSYDRAAQAELESIRIELELPDQHGTTTLEAVKQLTGADESPQVRLLRAHVEELEAKDEHAEKVMYSLGRAFTVSDHMGDAWDDLRAAFKLLALDFPDVDPEEFYDAFTALGGVGMYDAYWASRA